MMSSAWQQYFLLTRHHIIILNIQHNHFTDAYINEKRKKKASALKDPRQDIGFVPQKRRQCSVPFREENII